MRRLLAAYRATPERAIPSVGWGTDVWDPEAHAIGKGRSLYGNLPL